MARVKGFTYYHIFYEGEPEKDENGVERPPAHDFRCGPECPCEPKCVRTGPNSILVVHDTQDGLIVLADDATKG